MILDTLDPRYRVILCDIWGVVHDGVTVDPRAAKRLLQWRGEGRTIILITNAPRTVQAVEEQLGRLGLPRAAWDGVAIELCAGALADANATLGGRVAWYGKPHEAIYAHAFHLAGDPPRASIVAIGDGLLTDVLGAARQGIDCISA